MRRVLFFATVILFALSAGAQEQQQQEQQPITPDQLWAAMLNGNREFAAGRVTYDKLKEERMLFSEQQLPPISLLSCSDSRVPPELIFNQSLGALFVVRSAGNVADELGMASLEYALSSNFTKLIVVLGHENCGAVKASLATGEASTPALRSLAARIRSSFIGVPYDATKPENVKKAVEMNTRASTAHLLAHSALIRDAAAQGKIKLVMAYYDLDEGVVKAIE